MSKYNDDDFESDFADDNSIDDGPDRSGYFWVNAGTHEIVGDGNGPMPNVAGKIVCRSYFTDLQRGLIAFGEYGVNSQRLHEVMNFASDLGNELGLPFRECFFVVNEKHVRTREYLAIVYGKRRGGSAWARKNQLHSTLPLNRSVPGTGNISHLHVVHLNGVLTPIQPMCGYNRGTPVPLSGRCDCESPECAYSGV